MGGLARADGGLKLCPFCRSWRKEIEERSAFSRPCFVLVVRELVAPMVRSCGGGGVMVKFGCPIPVGTVGGAWLTDESLARFVGAGDDGVRGRRFLLGGIAEVCQHLPASTLVGVVSGRKPRFG